MTLGEKQNKELLKKIKYCNTIKCENLYSKNKNEEKKYCLYIEDSIEKIDYCPNWKKAYLIIKKGKKLL